MTEALFYWQKCCLAYKGDHTPCATPCNHCARMAKVMSQEFDTLRIQWLGMKDEIGLLQQAAQRAIAGLEACLPPKDTVTAGGPSAEIAYLKTALHVMRLAARDVVDLRPIGADAALDNAIDHLHELLPTPLNCNHWPGQQRCGVCGMKPDRIVAT